MGFQNDLVVVAGKRGSNWRLAEPLEYRSGIGPIFVPRDFCTDFASTPRILWWLIPPHGRYIRAAVVHDYLYSTKGPRVTRRTADAVFVQAMEEEGVGRCKRLAMYAAVRVFGRRNFRK